MAYAIIRKGEKKEMFCYSRGDSNLYEDRSFDLDHTLDTLEAASVRLTRIAHGIRHILPSMESGSKKSHKLAIELLYVLAGDAQTNGEECLKVFEQASNVMWPGSPWVNETIESKEEKAAGLAQ